MKNTFKGVYFFENPKLFTFYGDFKVMNAVAVKIGFREIKLKIFTISFPFLKDIVKFPI